jgi:hypothetical protein
VTEQKWQPPPGLDILSEPECLELCSRCHRRRGLHRGPRGEWECPDLACTGYQWGSRFLASGEYEHGVRTD